MTVSTVDVDDVAARAAAASSLWADQDPASRARALVALAGALRDDAAGLIEIATDETGLSGSRLSAELERTAVQLELFATVVADGRYLDVRIDERDERFALGVRPELRRYRVPVGPVLMFAAGNFPFAFSVLGGDTASALAAGCAVVVKGHSGHPRLAERVAALARSTLRAADSPADALQLITGQQNGVDMLRHRAIAAAAFTGSERVGSFLAGIAAARPSPIPFYGELGSVNPVFVTASAAAERPDQIAVGFLSSVSGSAGQLCTKPGFLFVPVGSGIVGRIRDAEADPVQHRMLTPAIARAFEERRETIVASGVEVVREGGIRFDGEGAGWVATTIVSTTPERLQELGPTLTEEAFGPLSIVVEYDDPADLARIADSTLGGNLTGSLHIGRDEDARATRGLVAWLTEHSGRVVFNGWPTGVAVTPAMQHGGPWPSSTNAGTTSVGTAAIDRFTRPVAFQDVPQAFLPAPVQDANPWHVPQARDRAGSSVTWGGRSLAT